MIKQKIFVLCIVFLAQMLGPISGAHAMKIRCSFDGDVKTPIGVTPYSGDSYPEEDDAELVNMLKGTICLKAEAYGPILAGDDELLNKFMMSHPFLHAIQFSSPGGRVDIAMKMGYIIRHNFLRTSVHTSCPANPEVELTNCCASACVLLWISGAKIEYGGDMIFLHRPSFSDLGNMPFESADQSLRKARGMISKYFDEMGAPDWLLEIMMATAPTDAHKLTSDEAMKFMKFYTNRYDPDSIPIVLQDWLAAKCSAPTSARCVHDEFEKEKLKRAFSLLSKSH